MTNYFNVPENLIENYTKKSGFWEILGEKYHYITTFRIDGDGEWFRVIVQRESDEKYFAFDWGRDKSNYYYEKTWVEVERIEQTVIVWETKNIVLWNKKITNIDDVKVYNEISIGESNPNKSDEQKRLEREIICLMYSFRPDKERIKLLKKQLKKIKK